MIPAASKLAQLPCALWVPGPLPEVNELIDARAVGGRNAGSSKYGNNYSKIKKQWTQDIGMHAFAQQFDRVLPPCAITFVHFELDRRRDPDGFCFVACKLILDALVKHKIMKNDGWTHVLDLRHHWDVRSPPGIGVIVIFDRVVWERKGALAVPAPKPQRPVLVGRYL